MKEVRILTVINVPVYLTIVILCDYNLTDLTIQYLTIKLI